MKLEFWRDVYGLDMTCIGNLIHVEPSVETLHPDTVITSVATVFELDLYTAKKEDAQFANKYRL